jgi:hypothetical protein
MTKQENFGDSFWYIVLQKPGVAEAELEANI